MPIASGPSASMSAFILAAMSEMASSHVASTYPSPTRRIGFMIRRGCSTSWCAVRPLAQKSCQVWGFCLSGEIFVTRLFSTATSTPQQARQYRQKVYTVLRLIPVSGTAFMPTSCLLGLRHGPIFAATIQQLGMAAPLDDPARLHHQNDVCVANRRKPVRDDETRPVAAQLTHRLLDQQLCPGVHGAGGLVENQQLRAGQKCARNGDELLFTRADVAAVVADPRLVAVGQSVHEPVYIGRLGRFNHLVFAGVRPPVRDVLVDRPAEQPG